MMNRKERTVNSAGQASYLERLEPNRREFLVGVGGAAVIGVLSPSETLAQTSQRVLNIARVAVPSSQVMASENRISSLNDGFSPVDSYDRAHALFSLRAERSGGDHTSWVQYDWSEPVSVNKVEIY